MTQCVSIYVAVEILINDKFVATDEFKKYATFYICVKSILGREPGTNKQKTTDRHLLCRWTDELPGDLETM